jgi:type IV pilus biogenesis protein CpaD/CtpE
LTARRVINFNTNSIQEKIMLDKAIALVMIVGIMPACTAPGSTIDEDFGAAVRHNIAVQTLNPGAGGPDASDSSDGRRTQQALEAYRTPQESAGAGQETLIIGVGNQ